MPQFEWEGQSADGETKRGHMTAATSAEVEKQLRQDRITPTKIKRRAPSLDFNISLGFSVNHKTLVVFTRQLATMIDAGLPLVQCLEILGEQEPNRGFQKIIEDVKTSLESGSTFADALKKHPRAFDELYCNLVAAGEMGGILDTILNRLAAYAEKSMKLKARVKSALKYPIVVFLVAMGVTALMLIKVIPTFADMFISMGRSELPPLTEGVMAASDWTIAHFPGIVIGLIVFIVLFKLFLRWEPGRKGFDRFLLALPIFGILLRKAAVAKFTRTLGTLVASGVPILDSLHIVAKTAGNKVIEYGIMYTRERIAEGKSIAEPLAETKIFPSMVVQMIGVGEATGALDVMLTKIADFYDDEVDQSVEAITSLIEPLIMVVLGGLIGFLLLAMYMPIFGMADNIGGAAGPNI